MKKLMALATVLIGLGIVAAPARAEEDILKKAINNPAISAWVLYGPNQTSSPINDESVAGGKAIRVEVTAASDKPWDATAQNAIKGKIKKGDLVYGAVWIKASVTEPGVPAQATIRIQEAAAPYGGLVQKTFTLTSDWQMYTVKVIAMQDYPGGTTNLALQLAHAKQTIDIGPGFVLDLGPPAQ
jgi:hypothetical protein